MKPFEIALVAETEQESRSVSMEDIIRFLNDTRTCFVGFLIRTFEKFFKMSELDGTFKYSDSVWIAGCKYECLPLR